MTRHLHQVRLLLVGTFLLGTVFGTLGVMVFGRGAGPPAYAQGATSCSNATLNGSYGALVQSQVLAGADGTPLDMPLPRAAFNLLVTDGAGNIIRSGTNNTGGTISENPGVGTYSVSPDCTFTVTYVAATGLTAHIAGVLVDSGRKAYVVSTDPGQVNAVQWERV